MVERLVESIGYVLPRIGEKTKSYLASLRIDTQKAINSIEVSRMSAKDQVMLEVVLNKMEDDQEAIGLALDQSQRRIEHLLTRYNADLKPVQPLGRPRRIRGSKA